MADSVGSLVIKLGVDPSGLTSGLNTAEGRLAKFADKASKGSRAAVLSHEAIVDKSSRAALIDPIADRSKAFARGGIGSLIGGGAFAKPAKMIGAEAGGAFGDGFLKGSNRLIGGMVLLHKAMGPIREGLRLSGVSEGFDRLSTAIGSSVANLFELTGLAGGVNSLAGALERLVGIKAPDKSLTEFTKGTHELIERSKHPGLSPGEFKRRQEFEATMADVPSSITGMPTRAEVIEDRSWRASNWFKPYRGEDIKPEETREGALAARNANLRQQFGLANQLSADAEVSKLKREGESVFEKELKDLRYKGATGKERPAWMDDKEKYQKAAMKAGVPGKEIEEESAAIEARGKILEKEIEITDRLIKKRAEDKRITETIKDLEQEITALKTGESVEVVRAREQGVDEKVIDNWKKLTAAHKEELELDSKAKSLKERISEGTTPREKLTARLKEIDKLQAAGKLTDVEAIKAVGQAPKEIFGSEFAETKKAMEDIGTPAQRFKKEMEKLQGQFERGEGITTEGEFAARAEAARKEIFPAPQKMELAGVATRGSAEAYKTIAMGMAGETTAEQRQKQGLDLLLKHIPQFALLLTQIKAGVAPEKPVGQQGEGDI